MKFIMEKFVTKEELQEAVTDSGVLRGLKPNELSAIFSILDKKGITFAQLPDYTFQIGQAQKVGIDFDTILAKLKDSQNADEFGAFVWFNGGNKLDDDGNNQLKKVVGENMSESTKNSVIIDIGNIDSTGLNEGDTIVLAEDVVYMPFEDAIVDWYDEEMSAEQAAKALKTDFGFEVKSFDGVEYVYIPNGTKMTLIYKYGPGGGWPNFKVEGAKYELEFAGEDFRAYKVDNFTNETLEDKKKKQGYFVKMNAGNPEENEKVFNKNMGNAEADAQGEAMAEELDDSASSIDLRKALNELDKASDNPCFVSMYDSIRLSDEDKMKLATMLTDDNKNLYDIYEFLASKYEDKNEISISKNTVEEKLNEKIVDYTAKFLSGQFTEEELVQLREDVVFGSLYTNDYKNRFNIDSNIIYEFFDGFESYIAEAKLDPQPEDDLSDDGDNINMLVAWYNIVDYSNFKDGE